MMTQGNSGRHGLLRTLAVVPTVGGLMVLFSFTAKATRYESADEPQGATIKISAVASLARDNGGKGLIIVDGKPFEGDINDIPSSDIASVTVFKDENSVKRFSKYGDTSNGVITVVTKSAPKTSFSGTVTDSAGKPIQGAVVEELGSHLSTVTDSDGHFALDGIPEASATVRVRFVGESAIVIADSSNKNIDFFLEAENRESEHRNPQHAAEGMPSFQGGSFEDFRYWVMERIRYPEAVVKNRLHGRVVASFVIDSEGALGDIGIISSPAEELSQEVRRVLSASPRWTQPQIDGKPASVRFTIPVDFAISGLEEEAQPDSHADDSAVNLDQIRITTY